MMDGDEQQAGAEAPAAQPPEAAEAPGASDPAPVEEPWLAKPAKMEALDLSDDRRDEGKADKPVH